MTKRAERRRYAILGVLAERGPSTHWEIGDHLHSRIGIGYDDLVALEQAGRLVAEWEAEPADRPPRRLYRLPTIDDRAQHWAKTTPDTDTKSEAS